MPALAVKPKLASGQKTSFEAIRVIDVACLVADLPQERSAANDELASDRAYTQRDPIGFVDGVNRYTYVRNNPVNYTDPTGELLINHLTGRLGIPVDDPDRIRMSNFTNAVALTGTSIAAAPFVAGTLGPAASMIPAPSSTVLVPGAIGGVSGALAALNMGGDARDVAIGGGVGFVAGMVSTKLPGSGFWANTAKGAGLGAASSTFTQSIDIFTDPNKTLRQNFSTGQVIGSTIGGGIAGGITAPFGTSTLEQISAAIIGYGPSTAGSAIGGALDRPSSQSLPSFTAPLFTGGGCASIVCTTNYTAGGGTTGVSRSK
jgi:hypothetical protein